jgi:hypothetical protein
MELSNLGGKLVKQFYLFGAVIGAVIPYVFFIDYLLDCGVNLPDFVMALFANGAVGGFTADLLISSAVFWGYMVSQREPKIWL